MTTLSFRSALLTLALTALSIAAPAEAQLFAEDFEGGAGDWSVSPSYPGAPGTLTDAAPACTSEYLHETIEATNGRLFSPGVIAVTPGATYCLSAWVRTPAGGLPFLGVVKTDGAGENRSTQHWLIGQANYPTAYGGGDLVTPIVDDGAWHFLTKSFKPGGGETFLRIQLEHWTTSTNGTYSDFDDVVVAAGACPAAPANSHTTCGGDTPACLPTGVCVECAGNDDCDGATPFCDTDANACVECLNPGHCSDSNDCTTDACSSGSCVNTDVGAGTECSGGVCDGAGVCLGCLEDDDCDGGTPACKQSTNTCVECTDSTDCDGATPYCYANNTCGAACEDDDDCSGLGLLCSESGACVECEGSADCSDQEPVCNTGGGGECVECLEDADCPNAKPVCDSASNTCEVPSVRDGGDDAGDDAGRDAGKDAGTGSTRSTITGGACAAAPTSAGTPTLAILLGLALGGTLLRRRRR